MHPRAGGAQIVAVAEATGQVLFVIDRQHRDLVHGTDVGVQRTERTGNREIVCHKGSRGVLAHRHPS
ncbi:hypothetical protein G6F35_019126 [Rhizopus arrhizus]|nr:hypothetical protein G6F35_019126 [Rhizopus arrhizus]